MLLGGRKGECRGVQLYNYNTITGLYSIVNRESLIIIVAGVIQRHFYTLCITLQMIWNSREFQSLASLFHNLSTKTAEPLSVSEDDEL